MKISTLLETNTTPISDPAGLQSQQAPHFGRNPKVLEDDKLDETTAGAIATVAQPLGGVQRRGQGSIFQGVKTSKKFPNSKAVKEGAKLGNPFMPGIENTPEYKQGFSTGKLPVPYPEGTQPYTNYYKGVIDRAGPKSMNMKESSNSYGYEVGQQVELDNGKQGKVLDIFDDSIEVLLPDGRTVIVDFRDAQVLDEDYKLDQLRRQAAPKVLANKQAWDALSPQEKEKQLRLAQQLRKNNTQPSVAEEKQRLDPKCWTGYKKQGTKMKGGVRVNNCVPKESVEEGLADDFMKMAKDMGYNVRKAGTPEQERERTQQMLKQRAIDRANNPPKEHVYSPEEIEKFKQELKDLKRDFDPNYEYLDAPSGGEWSRQNEIHKRIRHIEKILKQSGTDVMEAEISEEVLANELYKDLQIFKRGTDKEISKKAKSKDLSDKPKDKEIIKKVTNESAEQDMRANEILSESKPGLWANIHAKRERIKKGSGERMRKPGSKGAPSAQDFKDAAKTSKTDEAMNPAQQAAIAIAMKKKGQKPKNEEFNPEYDDEAGMADNNLETLERAVDGIDELINAGDNLPEWCQEKIAVAKSMLVTVWDYMKSEEEIKMAEAQFDMIEEMVESWAQKHGVDSDVIWEDLASVEDDELVSLSEDWQKVNKKDKTPGMSRKAVKAYRRENPGSKLQTAVTTKPSKLKKGSKAAKRRKSFCARMKGMKKAHASAKTKRNPDSPINKALRRWNC